MVKEFWKLVSTLKEESRGTDTKLITRRKGTVIRYKVEISLCVMWCRRPRREHVMFGESINRTLQTVPCRASRVPLLPSPYTSLRGWGRELYLVFLLDLVAAAAAADSCWFSRDLAVSTGSSHWGWFMFGELDFWYPDTHCKLRSIARKHSASLFRFSRRDTVSFCLFSAQSWTPWCI